MLNNLPVQYRRDPWLIVLAAALQVPIDRQGGVIRSLPNQISLDRVTWNLPVEERVAGIVPPAGATVEQRRAALRAKWRSSGKATLAQIQAVAESWESQRVETSFLAGVIGIDIINLRQGTVAEIPGGGGEDQARPPAAGDHGETVCGDPHPCGGAGPAGGQHDLVGGGLQ